MSLMGAQGLITQKPSRTRLGKDPIFKLTVHKCSGLSEGRIDIAHTALV